MTAPLLFLKAQVKAHTRHRNGRLIYVAPYNTRVPSAVPDPTHQRDARQGDLFGDVTPSSVITEPEYEEPDERMLEPLEVRHHVAPAADAPDLDSYDHILVMFSGGKDSAVLLHVARKALAPAPLPITLVHVDTGHNLPEVLDYRDATVAAGGHALVVARVEEFAESL